MYTYRFSACRKRKEREAAKQGKRRDFFAEKQRIQEEMDSQKEKEPKAAVSTTSSCRKYVNDDNATFLANLKDHFNEFINASMDEHKTCFKNTIDKIFGRSKEVETMEAESRPPLQAADST